MAGKLAAFGKWILEFYRITLDFAGRVIDNKLALFMLFLLLGSAVVGMERIERMAQIMAEFFRTANPF